MFATRRPGISLKRATLVSLALHFCVAALLVVRPPVPATLDRGANEIVRSLRVTISAHARRQNVHARIARLAPSVGAPAQSPPPRAIGKAKAPTVTTARAHARAFVPRVATASQGRIARSTDAPRGIAATSAPVAAPSTSADTAAVIAPATPLPAPTQAAIADVAVPPGGWGQSFAKPLVADDDELASLRASVRTTAAVAIDVDETGRAIRVTLPPSLPSDVRADIEKRLLALHYVPAECNGLRCTGTLHLTI